MSKYHSKSAYYNGIKFPSTLERDRYVFLLLMEKAGVITNLRMQVKYVVLPAITHKETIHLKTKDKIVEKVDQQPIYYTADFVYIKNSTGEEIVEDTKGSKEIVSRDVPLRLKLFYWTFGKKVRIVTKSNEEV